MHNKNSEAELSKRYSPNPRTKNYTEVFLTWKGKIIVLTFIWKNMFLTVNVKESQQKIYEKVDIKSHLQKFLSGNKIWNIQVKCILRTNHKQATTIKRCLLSSD